MCLSLASLGKTKGDFAIEIGDSSFEKLHVLLCCSEVDIRTDKFR